MLKIALPDGSTRTYRQLMTCRDVAADIGPGLAKAAIAAELDGKIVGLSRERVRQLQIEAVVSLRKMFDA